MPSLLVNWLFYEPVGHLVEALQHAHGYHRANPELELHLFLNSATPVELAEALPWVKRVYPRRARAARARARVNGFASRLSAF